MRPRIDTFRECLSRGDELTGIVVRTPSYQVVEVLHAALAPDVVMLDTEHAAWSPDVLDATLAVAVALDQPVLVRVPELSRAALQQPLDMGATGVVVPHVASSAAAESAVRLSRYGDGGRGYSGSTRSARWGTQSMAEVVATAAERTAVVVQIEDPAGVAEASAIAATPGVDAVFVGAADLAVALGEESAEAAPVVAALDAVVDACAAAGTSAISFAAGAEVAARWRRRGVACVLLGTDQSRLR